MNIYLKKLFIPMICINLTVFSIGEFPVGAKTTVSTIDLEPDELYETETKKNITEYILEEDNLVSAMSFGEKAIGTLRISGNINAKEPADSEYCLGIGVKEGQLSFSYQYDTSFLNEDSDYYITWSGLSISKCNGDNDEWIDVFNPIYNFLEDNKGNADNFYTTGGKDLSDGCYYLVQILYNTKEKAEPIKAPLLSLIPQYDYYQHMENYYFYASMNNGKISIHNLDVAGSDLPEIEGYSAEIISKGETLKNGDMAIQGFSIEKMNDCDQIFVNDEEIEENNKEFKKNGKYTIETYAPFSKNTQTVYIFNGGEDYGKSTYFGDYLVNGQRIFWDGKYPKYAAGAIAKIQAVSTDIPAITGTLTNLTTEEIILELNGKNRKEISCELPAGEYQGEFYSGNTDSGSYYHYTFHFIVSDEESMPHVNYNTLTSQARLSDFMSKHYEVTLPTTRGGNIYVCFADYDEAFAFAYEIEKRYIERNEDGLYYKTSFSNPNKIKHLSETDADKMKLTKIISENAEKSVEIAYFNPSEIMSIQEMDEKTIQKELESLTLAESKHVTLPEAKENLLKPAPYINDFQFIYVDDYESKSITALCQEDGKKYPLHFSEPVDTQLSVSSRYTITEKNQYNAEATYEVNYMAENQTSSTFIINQDGNESTKTIQNSEEITADSIKITKSTNHLDRYAVVTIKAPRIYPKELTCLVTELKGLCLYKSGDYELIFTDRVGNSYTVKLHLNGDDSMKNMSDSEKSYSEVYNSIHLNDAMEED